MDDLVVIILTLVILVIGVLGRTKKTQIQRPESKQPGNPMDFWDFFEMKDEIPASENINSIQTETSQEEDIIEDEPVVINIPEEEGSTVFEDKTIPVDKMEKKEKSALKSKLLESFSLKKAIIYSEIINRKYN